MTEILINEGTLFHNFLMEEVDLNTSRTQEIQGHAKHLNQLFLDFNTSISQVSRKMFRQLKLDDKEDPSIVFLSKFTIDLLGELSKKLNWVVKKLGN